MFRVIALRRSCLHLLCEKTEALCDTLKKKRGLKDEVAFDSEAG